MRRGETDRSGEEDDGGDGRVGTGRVLGSLGSFSFDSGELVIALVSFAGKNARTVFGALNRRLPNHCLPSSFFSPCSSSFLTSSPS